MCELPVLEEADGFAVASFRDEDLRMCLAQWRPQCPLTVVVVVGFAAETQEKEAQTCADTEACVYNGSAVARRFYGFMKSTKCH